LQKKNSVSETKNLTPISVFINQSAVTPYAAYAARVKSLT